MKNRKHIWKRGAALLLSLLLAAFLMAGCGDSSSQGGSAASSQAGEALSSQEESAVTLKPEPRGATDSEVQEKAITLKVVHGDGSEKEFSLSTSAGTLGEALEAEGLIEGEDSSYGLFITAVDGEAADDSNQEWWCLTKGGEVWNYGADATEISDGDVFELTLTVGY